MFGPTLRVAELEALKHAWATATSPSEKVEAGLELTKLGDFTPRAELLNILGSDGPALGRTGFLRLLNLVMAIATEHEATDDRLFELPDNDDGSVYLRVAGSGRMLLARVAAPRYVELAHIFDEIHDVTFELCTDSGFNLSGVLFDLYDDESTVDEWASQMRTALAEVDATYVFRGAAFSPLGVIDELLDGARRAVAGGPVLIRSTAELLFAWSGVPHPEIGDSLDSSAERTLEDYAERLRALPWRPGVTYFYGHDVDGGPGLYS